MTTTLKLTSFRVLVLIVATAWSLPSRADIPPACDVFDALITCDAADVGKACQGGGQCYAVSCGTSTHMTLYKCDACPAILSAPDAGCAPSNFGTTCGDGGMCASIQAYCNTSPTKYVCAGTAPAKPTGPPVGESGGAGGSSGAGNGGASGGSGGVGGSGASGGTGVLGGSSGAAGTGAGGSTGAGGTGVAVCPSCKSSGGCDVAPRATGPGAIALGLLAIGMLALLYDRRRKRRR
ncbi:MAG TPA: hypothetical protein VFG23_26680 [Polyangia bacterium]|nr:hypothetical protein [Polyangia bacterium]